MSSGKEGRACPPLPPTYSPVGCEAEGADVGVYCSHNPTTPTFHDKVTTRSNSTRIPTVRRGRDGSARAPRRGSGGPCLWACPVARVGWQDGLATCPRVTGQERAAAWRLS